MILLIHGEDDYRSLEKTKEVKKDFFKENPEAFFCALDFEDNPESNLSTLADVVSSGGLFSDKKLIIAKNLLGCDSEMQKKALIFFEKELNLNESKDVLLIVWEKKEVKGKGKLFSYIKEFSQESIMGKLSGKRFTDWIEKRVTEAMPGTSISKEAVGELVAFGGDDTGLLANEIEKLVLLKAGSQIEKKDVKMFSKGKTEANIFQAIDALGQGRRGEALRLLHGQLDKGEDPFYILSMYVYQFRNLLRIGGLYWKGKIDESAIARELKMHPFVVKKGMSQLNNFSFDELKNIYGKLQKFDLEVKTGKIDIETGLDKFIAELKVSI